MRPPRVALTAAQRRRVERITRAAARALIRDTMTRFAAALPGWIADAQRRARKGV
ncbi:MAG: hypothetical protein Q8S73_24475 [Deltaproteobacteria bacterium]|nr:hypothetical protein [Myxococcales bacterium]MDP3217290.1 hypothetical protein [Deltaproteobacteria bacterium]